MGRPVDDLDKLHWYLCGFGSEFSIISTTQLSISPLPSFTKIVPKAENYEIFVQSLESSSYTSSPAAFTTSHNAINTYGLNSGRGSGHYFRGGNDKGFHNNHNRPIRCQICHVEGHYTSSCNDQYSRPSESTHLMEAFTSCSVNDSQTSNWYTDTA